MEEVETKEEQFEIKYELQNQMERLMQRKVEEERKRREEISKAKQFLLAQLKSKAYSNNIKPIQDIKEDDTIDLDTVLGDTLQMSNDALESKNFTGSKEEDELDEEDKNLLESIANNRLLESHKEDLLLHNEKPMQVNEPQRAKWDEHKSAPLFQEDEVSQFENKEKQEDEIEEDYAEASFDKEPIEVNTQHEVKDGPDAEDIIKNQLIVVDFGNNIDEEEKKKHSEAFKARIMKHEQERKDKKLKTKV